MNISERLAALRREMEQESIDIYIVPSDDFHQSEYVGEYFKARQFITGFTGSAGTAVITKNMAGLWTDGRYFIQAEKELAGSGITLFKSGEPGVDTIEQFLEKELPSMGVIGFDGRTVGVNTGKRYAQIAAEKHGSVSYHSDLIGRIWNPWCAGKRKRGLSFAPESFSGRRDTPPMPPWKRRRSAPSRC